MTVSTDDVLTLLQEVAAEAITPRFRALADGDVMEKRPGDLVTVADHEAEVLLTRALTAAYPDAVVLGEEAYAADRGLLDRFRAAAHAFTVDPVDGTKNFVHGSPDHAVMVSETRDAEPVRAWIWQPEHRRAWVAERGAGTYRDGVRVQRAPVPAGTPPLGATSAWPLRGQQLAGLPTLRLSWVCCGVDYPQLLEGACDYILYQGKQPWDHLPGTLLLREAGAVVTHGDGTAYTARSDGPGLLAAADPQTYAVIQPLAAPRLRALRSAH